MRLVIADTGPINYLILIGEISVLPALFERVILPTAVRDELMHPDAPAEVRRWMSGPPEWLETIAAPESHDVTDLGAGETAAIALALDLKAELLLMDDRRGVKVARRNGFDVTGTLGILSRAGQLGMLDLADAFRRLKLTSFRYRQEVMNEFLSGSSES